MLMLKTIITSEMFKHYTKRDPEQDDLERVNCKQVGQPGHYCCGWCHHCKCPVFECGHTIGKKK